MFQRSKLSRVALAVAMSVGLSTTALAQETASAIKGKIVGPNGSPAAGTSVTVTHLPSGTSRQVIVGETGTFNLRGLRVGGPYSIVVDSQTYQDTTIGDVYLNLGDTYGVDLTLEDASDVEVIAVTGSALSTSAFGATGPQTVFNLESLQTAPAINRSLGDIVRADPRVFLNEGGNDSISCGGSSPRFNSLTLDGIRLNDAFGLNSNGFPTERQPFSYDAIQEVAVELAPFDVEYGGFTACNINAVTKSGTNEITGGAFYDFTSDSYRGDEVNGVERDNGNFTERRYGANVGFPLIEDKLFFFGAYEKLEGVTLFNYDALGNSVTQGEIDQITEIAQRVYGYDAGGLPGSAPVEDEKILVKLDWNISDAHRANLVYNWNDGFNISQSDGGSTRLSLDNHFYERGAELTAIVGSLFSDWTENFSTELRIGHTDLDNRQISLDQASGFAEAQIRTEGRGTVYIGPDDSRQSNDLNYEVFNFKLAGTYYWGDHTITAGVEYEEVDIFNLFMQHTVGEYRFNSIADFEAGLVDRIYYNNSAGTNNPDDAAASFAQDITTFYVQDEFYLTDDLKIMAGLRYERYGSDDRPTANQNFANRYGYSNTTNVDGIDLLQPRVGFNYTVNDDLEVRGGFGLFSGGNPNVWISNAYSNDGVTNVGIEARSGSRNQFPGFVSGETTLFDLALTGQGRPIYDIPQGMFDIVANTSITDGDARVNATDPDFDIPSEWKYNLGATWVLPGDYVLNADVIYTDRKDAPIIRDANLVRTNEVTFDGRPVYDFVDASRGVGQDFLLSNADGDSGSSLLISAAVSKEWDFGLDATLGYAYVDAEEVHPMTSSVAFSNFTRVAVTDVNNPTAAPSNYAVGHRFTFNLGYEHEFFDGYATRVNLFMTANEGAPYSFVFGDNGTRDFGDPAFSWDTADNRQLLYIPLENDPNVVYATPEDQARFDEFVNTFGLERGTVTSRNDQDADWWIKADIRISQDLPGFWEGHRASAFFVINNLTNLLNDEWGDFSEGQGQTNITDVSLNDQGQWVYSGVGVVPQETTDRGASLWEMRFGINYNF